MESVINEIEAVALSKEVETEGFDSQTGETWIYPTNYPTRDYQYNIIQKALLKNTLVSLPTGLGKTFIAAVVMYNFYRWYPHGKIIFMAPTKPLVKQQVDACYNIMAIPAEVTAELTGAKASSARANIWAEKRVFYITPQVLQNDLNKIAELGSKIKCLVFDEAHKAKGNHAYCEVIRRLLAQDHKYFRVLALSATPGSHVNDVLDVIQNLLISHVEFRTEESLDVAPYVFRRSLETIVVPLNKKLEEVRDSYLKILEQYVKTLIRFNVVQGNCGSLTKGKIFVIMKDFQNKNRGTGSSNYSEIMRCLNICVTLYHAFELLIRHGLRNFLSFYDEHIEKPLLRGNTQLRDILSNVREYLGPIPDISVLPDGTYPEIPKNITFGHPKYYKLRDVLLSHFSNAERNSRVIVFFEYRESVMEAHMMLLQSRPLIQPKIFLGQGSGITQTVQIGVIKSFREGKCNTLLSTCIGEEGLDVGEVDLIICFDISNKSPIRMVQRMGRTGRKREGRIVVLVTEGKEQQTLKDCLIHKNNISTFVLESKQLNTGLYPDSPRLVPTSLTPRCEKMFITVKQIAKKKSVKDMLKSLSSNSSEPVFSQEVNILDVQERIPKTIMLFNKGHEKRRMKENRIFYKFIEKQRSTQKTHKVKHSKNTKILIDLLCSADSKRFNIPSQSLTQGSARKILKQGDIRNMFFKQNSQLDFQPSQTRTEVLVDIPTQVIAKEAEEPADKISDGTNLPKELFTLISNYLFTQMENPLTECRHCPWGFRCEDFTISTAPYLLLTNNNNWVPSEDILDTISFIDLENFSNSLDPTYRFAADSPICLDPNELSQFMDDEDSQIFNNVNFTQLEEQAEINSRTAEADKSFHFEAPKTLSNLLNKFGNSIFISQQTTQVTKEPGNDIQKPSTIEPEDHSEISEKSLLEFFMLDSFTDIYGNSSRNSSQSTVIYSQDFSDLDSNEYNYSDKTPSPILSLHERKKNVKAKPARDSSIKQTRQNIGSNLPLTKNDRIEEPVKIFDLNDFCDLSYYGISDSKIEEKEVNKSVLEEIGQICDLSQFGILPEDENIIETDADFNIKHINDDGNDNGLEVVNQFDDFLSQNGSQMSDKENYINNHCENLNNKAFTSDCLSTQKNKGPVIKMDQTVVDFDLPAQPTNVTEKCVLNSSKLNITQKSSYIDSFEDDNEVFAMATQPNLNKSHILTLTKNEFQNQDKFNSSGVEEEICVELTLLSPTPTNEKRILSCESQIPVTQMLSLLNKPTQKELTRKPERSTDTIFRKAQDSVRNNNRNVWMSKLSTKKNISTRSSLTKIRSKSVQPKEVDPYFFSKNIKSIKEKAVEKRSTSSDEFEDSVFLRPDLSSRKPRKKYLEKNVKDQNKRREQKHTDFLDLEAKLEEDEDVSDDEDEEDLDHYEKSFVNDETQNFDSQMHAKYLQSVRSPANPQRFKIPIRPPVNISNIYSQPPSTQFDTYLEDSFCIDIDDDKLTQESQLSPLEILERKLKEKKRKKSDKQDESKPKRRRVICFASDDSD